LSLYLECQRVWCVWRWLFMGKLSLLLDVHEILMLFIKMLICLENRLSSSFRCNISWCSFAFWNNDRVLLGMIVIASINIMWIVLYCLIVFCVFWCACICFYVVLCSYDDFVLVIDCWVNVSMRGSQKVMPCVFISTVFID